MAQRRVKHSDPFLVKYQPSELKIASEFLSTWLPFLSKDLCDCCTDVIANRVRSLESEHKGTSEQSNPNKGIKASIAKNSKMNSNKHDVDSLGSWNDDGDESNSLCSWKDGENGLPSKVSVTTTTSRLEGESPSMVSVTPKMSWADMAQEDELEEEEEEGGGRESGHQRVNEHPSAIESSMSEVQVKPKLPREQREYLRFMNVKRTKDFICLERVDKKFINIVDGLELHESIFSAAEQKRIVDYVYMLEEKGRNKELKDRTFTAPQKWMRGKGRITIQFGCCYNYATDRKGNPPGILYNEMVDPIPHLFKVIIRRLVQWHVLPPTCVPDSCIVNIYEEGDCIPPHIDNHDFVRPFCTLSFLSECNILFGSSLKIVGPGEFSGPYAIPLPVGSVLVLQGNGADVAKHCVPAVPSKRISITFRRMNENRRPAGYEPEPDLVGIKPLPYVSDKTDNNFSSPRSDQRHSRRHPNRRGSSNFDPRPSGGRTESHSEPRYSSQGRGMFRRPS